jgi:hypothetical protein
VRGIGTEGLEEKAWHAGALQQINGDLLILVGHSVGQWSRSEVSVHELCVGVSRVLKKTSMVKLTVFCPLYSDLAVRTMLGSTSYFPTYNCYCYSATVFSVTFYAVIVLEYFIFIYLG